MTDLMRAALVREFGAPLVVEDVPVPVPGPYQVLIKVHHSGVCRTDLQAARGDWHPRPPLPFIPGHEGNGTVVALGPSVTDVRIGDRLGSTWLASACGRCEYCASGRESLCPAQRNAGYTAGGSFAEYMVVDSRYAARVPESADSATLCPVLCAGLTAHTALKKTGARAGQWVVISGIGGLGHLVVQYAQASGMRVIAVDIDEEKLALARSHGAELTINARGQDPVRVVQTQLSGAHAAVVTAVTESAFVQGLAMLRRGGTMVLVGLPPAEFPLPIVDTVMHELTVRGSIAGSRQDLAEALAFYAQDLVRPTITVRPLSEVNQVLIDVERGLSEGQYVLDVSS